MGPFGHLSAGFVIRSRTPLVPLPVLLVSAYFIEIMYFAFAAFGMETPEWAPWSHGLITSVAWALIGGGLYGLIRKSFHRGAVVAAAVFSHWILDFIVWNDLPFAPGMSGGLGLGLYPFLGFDIAEAGMTLPTVLITVLDLSLFTIGIVLWRMSARNHAAERASKRTEGRPA